MDPIDLFRTNLRRSRKAVYLYDKQRRKGEGHNKIADLLRMSLVMSLSSLDAYMHQVISDNLVSFIKRNLRSSDRYNRLGGIDKLAREIFNPIDYLQMFGRSRPFVQFKKRLEEALLLRTYQSPEGIEHALRLFGVARFWEDFENSYRSNRKKEAPKLLQVFYERRNEIVHQMDRERSRKKKHKERKIDRDMCIDCQKLVELIVNHIEKNYLDNYKSDFILK